MSNNKTKTGLIIGAVFIAAIGGGYLLFRNWAKGTSLTPLEAAKLVPQDAMFAGYFTTNSETWSKLDRFGTKEFEQLVLEPAKKQFAEASKENAGTEGELSYEKDIQPWLGNIMLAALPSANEEPDMLMVIGIKDKVEALKFVDKIKKEAEDSIQTIQYKGFTIIESTDESSDSFNIGIVDDLIVASPETEIVKKAIDTYQGNSSFANKEGAKEILSKTSESNDTLFQLYVPSYKELLKQSLQASGEDMANFKAIEKQLGYVDSIVISVGIKETRGIAIETIAKLNPDSNIPKYQDLNNQVLGQIPGNSLLLITTGRLAQSWPWIVEQFGEDTDFKEALEEARESVKLAANLDLDKDIIGWMDGEIAISVLPSNTPPAPISGAIVLTTSDRSTAENTIEKLEELAESNGAPISNKTVSGKEITEYQNYPGGQVVFAYGWLDDKSLAISIADTADRLISLKPADSIAQNSDFQNSTKDFPKNNYGYFYLNFKEVNTLITNLSASFGQPIPPEGKAVLDSIISIVGVSTMPDSLTVKQELLFELATNE